MNNEKDPLEDLGFSDSSGTDIEERKPRNSDKKRLEKLESDVLKIKEMLHKMSSALGLPKNILPPLD